MKVSVVILNYNYARYLGAAIDSALAQTHPDVEVVVVDDASTDDSQTVIDRYRTRVRAVTHRHNRGQGAAINTGAGAATGELVWFVDADDALLPEACATAVAAAEQTPGLGKFHCPLAVVDRAGRWHGDTVPGDPTGLATGDLVDHVFRYRSHGWPPMTGNAFPAGTLARILPVPEERYRQAADSFVCEQAAICGPLARSERPLAVYRVHGDNQFAGTKADLRWLRTKLSRERCSHQRLGLLSGRLDRPGFQLDPTAALDVALLGYRLASLRLDPDGHPRLGQRDDTRLGLATRGVEAAVRSPHLTLKDRVLRSVWFPTVAAAPFGVDRLLSVYLPDGPEPPIWHRRRPAGWRRRQSTQAPVELVGGERREDVRS